MVANTAGGTTRFNVEPASQTMDQHHVNVLHVLYSYRVCWVHAASQTLIDPPTMPDHVTSYDHWACAQTSHAPPCGKAVGQCDAARSNLYRWTSQHDANVVRKHQDIVENVTEFPEASGYKIKASWCRDAWTLWGETLIIIYSFGNNPENFAKFHLVFQKLDHLTCNAILRINRDEVNRFIHGIEESHK